MRMEKKTYQGQEPRAPPSVVVTVSPRFAILRCRLPRIRAGRRGVGARQLGWSGLSIKQSPLETENENEERKKNLTSRGRPPPPPVGYMLLLLVVAESMAFVVGGDVVTWRRRRDGGCC
jgi:hypothetical protein